jgi:hypothetical protein
MLTISRPRTFLRRLTGLVVAGLLLAAGAGAARAAEAKGLQREMLDRAPDVLRFLREHNYRSVGVLKFGVKKDGKASSNAGPLNLNLAHRLENDLLLKYDQKMDQNLVLLHDASATAAKLGVDHTTADGRARLLKASYQAYWGTQPNLQPDALLTGLVEFGPTLRTITVGICSFDRAGNVDRVATFTARTDLNTLVEAGESFNLRAALTKKRTFEIDDLGDTGADHALEAKHTPSGSNPLDGLDILLEVHYKNRRTQQDRVVPVTHEGGENRLQEPTEDEEVCFHLRRLDPSQSRYGVVLMVNGVNTLYDEHLPPQSCTKWIFEQDSTELVIDGFHVKDGVGGKMKFHVQSPDESRVSEVKYGADCGVISFSIFREQTGAPAKSVPPDQVVRNPEKQPEAPAEDPVKRLEAKAQKEAEKKEELSTAGAPPPPPADLPRDAGPVQTQLRKTGLDLLGVRGVIDRSGFAIDSYVEHVSFKSPVLVSNVSIRYYKAGKH